MTQIETGLTTRYEGRSSYYEMIDLMIALGGRNLRASLKLPSNERPQDWDDYKHGS